MRPSTKLLLAVFLVGCAGGTLMRDSLMTPARAESAPPGAVRYEFRIYAESRPFTGAEDRVAVLNQLGQQGFHLAGAMLTNGAYEYIFERPVTQATAPQAPKTQPSDGGGAL